MNHAVSHYDELVHAAVKSLLALQSAESTLSSWTCVLGQLVAVVAQEVNTQQPTSNGTFPTNIPDLLNAIKEKNQPVIFLCATVLSDAMLLFFRQFIGTAGPKLLSSKAQSQTQRSCGAHSGMFGPFLSLVVFLSIFQHNGGHFENAWSAYTDMIRGEADLTPAIGGLPTAIAHNQIQWRVLVALFFGVCQAERKTKKAVSLSGVDVRPPTRHPRQKIVVTWMQKGRHLPTAHRSTI